MHRLHSLAHLTLLFGCLVLASGCSGQDTAGSNGQGACDPGMTRHPITGACTPVAQEHDAGADLKQAPDMRAPQDMAAPPDMSAPDQDTTQDMGQDQGVAQDMGGEADMGAPEVVRRFVAIGDTGTGSDKQIKVGQSIGAACQTLGGCDFGLLLGDNVYDSGVSSDNDPLFHSYFTIPYGHLPFTWFAVLGNHDLGGSGLGLDLDWNKGDYQVDYSTRNPKWVMPAKFYQVLDGPVWLVGLNTTDVFFDRAANQKRTVLEWRAAAPEWPWKIAFGHHPYISNGKHGNAGEYDGVPFIPIANGEHVKSFMESTICGKFDLYLCGHDHSIQDLQKTCGTEFVISGAGAKTTELKGDNPAHYQSDRLGFVIVEATYARLTLRFYDEDANLKHQREIRR